MSAIDRITDTIADHTPFRGGTIENYYAVLEVWIIAPFRAFWSHPRARVGTVITLFFIFMGTIGPRLVERPSTNQGPPNVTWFETTDHILGTSSMGHDIISLTVYGTTPILQMIVAGVTFATGMAIVVGTIAGYVGGLTDRILTTFTDIALTIPGLPLIIVLGFILEPRSHYLIGIILTIAAWGGLARMIRSEVLSLREESYVEASRAIGVRRHRILTLDVLPNIMPFVLVGAVNQARLVIFNSVVLYFLGILPFTTANWGVMLNQAYESAAGAPIVPRTVNWIMPPIIAIVLFTFGLILLSQGLDRLFNPRLRAKHESTSSDVEVLPQS